MGKETGTEEIRSVRPFCTACAAQVRVARAHGAERSLAERYAAAVTEVTRVQGRHGVAYGLSRIALGAVKCASSVGVLAYGAARCLLYTSPSPRDQRGSRMPSSA